MPDPILRVVAVVGLGATALLAVMLFRARRTGEWLWWCGFACLAVYAALFLSRFAPQGSTLRDLAALPAVLLAVGVAVRLLILRRRARGAP